MTKGLQKQQILHILKGWRTFYSAAGKAPWQPAELIIEDPECLARVEYRLDGTVVCGPGSFEKQVDHSEKSRDREMPFGTGGWIDW